MKGNLDQIVDEIFLRGFMELSDVIKIIHEKRWEIFNLVMEDDILMLFSEGDYRIYDWMSKHKRKDY